MALANCAVCKKKLSERATSCPHCGELDFLEVVVCLDCGNTVERGNEACTECGNPEIRFRNNLVDANPNCGAVGFVFEGREVEHSGISDINSLNVKTSPEAKKAMKVIVAIILGLIVFWFSSGHASYSESQRTFLDGLNSFKRYYNSFNGNSPKQKQIARAARGYLYDNAGRKKEWRGKLVSISSSLGYSRVVVIKLNEDVSISCDLTEFDLNANNGLDNIRRGSLIKFTFDLGQNNFRLTNSGKINDPLLGCSSLRIY